MKTTLEVFSTGLGRPIISPQSANFGFLDDDLVINSFYATFY